MPDVIERKYVSRYSQPGFGLRVHQAGTLTDADSEPVVSFFPEGATAAEFTLTSTRQELGVYAVVLSSAQTSVPRMGTLMWDYTIGGEPQVYGIDIEIGPSSPSYDALAPDWQGIVENVWRKFADLFDSPYGGPHLQVYVQTHFGRNRLAQMMGDAIGVLNTVSSPHQFYELNGINFPFREWGNLLEQALYVEVLKHLVRSYVEQPEVILGTAVSRLDRRDYMDRWRTVLDMEAQSLDSDLKRYRMAHLGLGNVSVLVSGGAFGKIGYGEPPGGLGAAAARGYFYVSRWH